MQTISGVRYNFHYRCGVLAGEMRRYGETKRQRKISAGYFRLIYLTITVFGWVIPYLFVARLRPFVPLLSCKGSQPHYRLKNGLRHVLPAICDVAAFDDLEAMPISRKSNLGITFNDLHGIRCRSEARD